MPRIKFVRGKGFHKYTAILPDGQRVSFGDKRYQHYKDRTPLKLYSYLDHLDPIRRRSYRARHGASRDSSGRRYVDVKYTPAWFSWRYLW